MAFYPVFPIDLGIPIVDYVKPCACIERVGARLQLVQAVSNLMRALYAGFEKSAKNGDVTEKVRS